MENPCKRDCPDRFPGCDCERRHAWKFIQAQRREERRLAKLVDCFRAECIVRSKEYMRKSNPRR